MEYTEINLRLIAEDNAKMEKEVRKVKFFFRKKADWAHKLVAIRKEIISNRNADLKPEYDTRYICGTCGSKDGAEHPKTGYCFYCDTDNWWNKEQITED